MAFVIIVPVLCFLLHLPRVVVVAAAVQLTLTLAAGSLNPHKFA